MPKKESTKSSSAQIELKISVYGGTLYTKAGIPCPLDLLQALRQECAKHVFELPEDPTKQFQVLTSAMKTVWSNVRKTKVGKVILGEWQLGTKPENSGGSGPIWVLNAGATFPLMSKHSTKEELQGSYCKFHYPGSKASESVIVGFFLQIAYAS